MSTKLILAAGLVLAAAARVTAQEPLKSFDQLNTQLAPGNTVYVTDTAGRETKGRIVEITPSSLKLSGKAGTFTASDVRTVYHRPDDSLRTGALVGLGVGAGFAVVLGALLEDAEFMAVGALIYGGIGAGIGAGIDALIPWPKRLVYAAAPGSGSGARLSVAPVVTPRTKGVALSVSF